MDTGRILKGMQDSISHIQRDTGDLTIAQLSVLLLVMRRGRVTGMDICKALDMSRPTTSRIVALLSDEETKNTRKHQEPLALIRFDTEGDRADPYRSQTETRDRRVKSVVLTEKGESLVRRIVESYSQ